MLEPTARLRVRVAPGAARSEIAGRYGAGWKVRIAAPAEGGRANAALLAFLAERLDLAREQVALVSGRASRDKVVELRGLSAEEAGRRLGGGG
jgi:hypothetical protein